MILTVRDETASGSVTNELTLDVLAEQITVRELIRSRVYQEVQDYNLRQRRQAGAAFRGLVTPTDAEQTLNGVRLRTPREIDWKQQFDKASDAFTRNGFFILMEPNDQYLCIVPSRSSGNAPADVFLPFEGDVTLSIILSKAFLLAEDKKIKATTITRQIARGD